MTSNNLIVRFLRILPAMLLVLVLLPACGGTEAGGPQTEQTAAPTELSANEPAATPVEEHTPGPDVIEEATPTETMAEESTPAMDQAGADAEPIQVVATFSILEDLVRNVGGERVNMTTMVPVGADAHTFEPSPADGVALVQADVIVEIGQEFETWLPRMYEASNSSARRVVVTEGIDLLRAGEHTDEPHDDHDHAAEATPDDHGHDHAGEATPDDHDHDHAAEATPDDHDHAAEATPDDHGHDHDHGEYDPHVWHDVNNAIIMVERIRDGLSAADPHHAAVYDENAAAYIEQLRVLDRWVVEQVETLPPERRKLVTAHDSFAYFARRYGFEIVGTALGSVSTEVADPSAREFVALVEQIRAAGVPAIFAEDVTSNALMERIAAEAGVEVAPTLYTDALGEPGSEGATYETMMRYNIETIVQALQG
jgi:zinc/manganese transport system substrate-binding protein